MHIPTKQVTVELDCDICGASCGQLTLDVPLDDNTVYTKQAVGIIDQRCDTCEAEHGTFGQLVAEYAQQEDVSIAQAEEVVAEVRTRANLEAALDSVV